MLQGTTLGPREATRLPKGERERESEREDPFHKHCDQYLGEEKKREPWRQGRRLATAHCDLLPRTMRRTILGCHSLALDVPNNARTLNVP